MTRRSEPDIRTTGPAWITESELAWLCNEVNELRGALIRIEAFAGELEGRHTGFIHVGRMARLALREYDRAK